MKISNFKRKNNTLSFAIKGINVAMANAIRRAIITNVPIAAIEKVTIDKNSSVLADEILAHRLGLIPIKTNAAFPDTTFLLDVECNSDKLKTVYSGDLKSSNPDVVAVYDSMPIVNLSKGQVIKLEAITRLGKGRDHAKWQGGLASYEVDEKENDKFNFFVESYGQYEVDELIKAACDELLKENRNFRDYVATNLTSAI